MTAAAAQRRPFEPEDRRFGITQEWRARIGGADHVLSVTFNFDARGLVNEVFCSGHKEGSHMRAIVTDSCIAISHTLQRGGSIVELAAAFGEDREEGRKSGASASVLGAIARQGAIIERNAATYICPRTDERCALFLGERVCACAQKGAIV
jgi:hypothetical protein